MRIVLGLDDNPPQARPGIGCISELAKVALRLLRLCPGLRGRFAPSGGQLEQARIPGHADHILHRIALAPGQQQGAAKTRVAAEQDAPPRPCLTQARHQQLEKGGGMQCGILAGRAQVSRQQLFAAKDVQRQEAIVVVIRAEVAALLIAMHQIVGGIEVENQLGRRLLERRDELIDDHAVDGNGASTVGAILEAAQGGAGGGGGVAFERGLQGQVVAQMIVIVEIFVALAQPEHALAQQMFGGVVDQRRMARVGQHLRDLLEQAKAPFDFTQQQQAAVGTDLPAIETHIDGASLELGK